MTDVTGETILAIGTSYILYTINHILNISLFTQNSLQVACLHQSIPSHWFIIISIIPRAEAAHKAAKEEREQREQRAAAAQREQESVQRDAV